MWKSLNGRFGLIVIPFISYLRKDMVDPIFSKTNILVVDDFEPWRSKVREILQARPEWTIVSEACDGPEAVQKATTLQPDIILLDLGFAHPQRNRSCQAHSAEMSRIQNHLFNPDRG
jgi:PleD family two-component response regulator